MSDVDRACEREGAGDRDLESHCITCGDDGVDMVVVGIDADRGLALCQDAEGQRQSVETALVAPVQVGDLLLVHAGTALTTLEQVTS
jgi:hydrogenase maturation factor